MAETMEVGVIDEQPSPVRVVDRFPTMPEIVRACSAHFELPSALIRDSKRGIASIIYPRHVAMFLCRVDARRSYSEIGYFFNNRDHTTVRNADQKIFKLRADGNPQLEDDLAKVRRILQLALNLVPKESVTCQDCRLLQEQNETLRQELALAKQDAAAMRVRFGCD